MVSRSDRRVALAAVAILLGFLALFGFVARMLGAFDWSSILSLAAVALLPMVLGPLLGRWGARAAWAVVVLATALLVVVFNSTSMNGELLGLLAVVALGLLLAALDMWVGRVEERRRAHGGRDQAAPERNGIGYTRS